jgi:hypothetical protein
MVCLTLYSADPHGTLSFAEKKIWSRNPPEQYAAIAPTGKLALIANPGGSRTFTPTIELLSRLFIRPLSGLCPTMVKVTILQNRKLPVSSRSGLWLHAGRPSKLQRTKKKSITLIEFHVIE